MAAISDLQISASFEKAAKRREAIRANPDGNTRNREAREARFHGEQKTEWWPRVKSAHSSFFRSAFSPLFSLLSNGQERRRGEGLVCRYARGMRHEKPPAGQISERNGRMSYFPYAGLRNREPIRSRFLLAHSCSSFVCNSMDFPFFLR